LVARFRRPARALVVSLVLAGQLALGGGQAHASGLPAFRHAWSRITPALATRMHYSWRPGCPVPLSQLRYVRVSYVGFDGRPHYGEIVVNAKVLTAVVGEFRRLYAMRFPIRRMHLVDDYKGVDEASMGVDNTSSFNCRPVQGSSSWSMHAFGEAIDLNPIENPSLLNHDPYKADPPAGQAYLDRSRARPGMVDASVRAAFSAYGWGWGGHWSDRDLMHFSSNGK
jgi:poly-gamma-glutamate synthesis protein (capsule biosynthesis protein)